MGSDHLHDRRLRDPNAESEHNCDGNGYGYGFRDGNDCAIARS